MITVIRRLIPVIPTFSPAVPEFSVMATSCSGGMVFIIFAAIFTISGKKERRFTFIVLFIYGNKVSRGSHQVQRLQTGPGFSDMIFTAADIESALMPAAAAGIAIAGGAAGAATGDGEASSTKKYEDIVRGCKDA